MTKVQGKRSPRWAFMQRMTIPCKDGTEYLIRLRICADALDRAVRPRHP